MEAGGNRRRGRGGQRLLYWFRTPPGVRVGRVALDEEGIRLIEQHNPDIQFDWARLLKESAPEPPRRERDGREGRDRDRRERRDPRHPPRPRPMETSAAAAPPMPGPEAAEEIQELAEAAAERAAEHAEVLAAASGDLSPLEPASYAEPELEPEPERELERSELEPGEPERRELAEPAEPAERSAASPAAARLGADGLVRLRARYLDLKGRLAEKEDLETDARAELAADLERLNPDAWVTPDEVSGALEQYESIFERLRSVVGRHPRRRV